MRPMSHWPPKSMVACPALPSLRFASSNDHQALFRQRKTDSPATSQAMMERVMRCLTMCQMRIGSSQTRAQSDQLLRGFIDGGFCSVFGTIVANEVRREESVRGELTGWS